MNERKSNQLAILGNAQCAELSCVLFPLTPALSLGERENLLRRCERGGRCRSSIHGRRCSRSPRERAGVRGKGACELNTTFDISATV